MSHEGLEGRNEASTAPRTHNLLKQDSLRWRPDIQGVEGVEGAFCYAVSSKSRLVSTPHRPTLTYESAQIHMFGPSAAPACAKSSVELPKKQLPSGPSPNCTAAS